MAWKCVRCGKRIFRPRENSIKHAVEWRYVKMRRSLTTDLRNLHNLEDNAVVTHAACSNEEQEGFDERMKAELGLPATATHALLI